MSISYRQKQHAHLQSSKRSTQILDNRFYCQQKILRRVWNPLSAARGAVVDTVRSKLCDCVFFCPGCRWMSIFHHLPLTFSEVTENQENSHSKDKEILTEFN